MLKALYGLKKGLRSWYECFNEFLQNLKFRRNESDYCLNINCENGEFIYILIFVDDMLICSKNKKLIDVVKKNLSERFMMKDMGKVINYIGIDINIEKSKNTLTLNQTKYIKSLTSKCRLELAKNHNTPMEVNLKLKCAEKLNQSIKYRNLIRELLYISTGTRPDVVLA